MGVSSWCNAGVLSFSLAGSALSGSASAASPDVGHKAVLMHPIPGDPHVRPVGDGLAEFVKELARKSKEIRRLLEIITSSDVVVYIVCDAELPPTARGRLSFLTSAGGHRYLWVRLRPKGSPLDQAAALGHELRHAAEIAAAPSIVDSESLEREYLQVGYLNVASGKPAHVRDRRSFAGG
jgi:hypothetical protein